MKRTTLALALATLLPTAALAADPSAKISARLDVLAKSSAPVRVLIVVRSDMKAARVVSGERVQRITEVYAQARRRAKTAETGVIAELDRRGIAYRAFDNVPAISASMTRADMLALAMRDDIEIITTDPAVRIPATRRELGPGTNAKVVTSAVAAIGAPTIWAQGHTGEGIVIGGNDTGFVASHPALRTSYRGYRANTTVTVDDYNWHDGVREPVLETENECGYATIAPCDDDGHGTHTMGTMVGKDGPREIGVAPGAKWIGCRNMDHGSGTPSTYLDCFEWFLAPTNRAGENPRPDMAPHVINNSWLCTPGEGCDPEHTALLREATSLLEAAGIVVVAAAGNYGPNCNAIGYPPANFSTTLTVAATASNGSIASFSSRGPSMDQGVTIMKPDLGAPGVNIYSSTRDGAFGYLSGTSMASPHVAGAVALLLSSVPELIGEPALVRQVLTENASPRFDAVTCGGYPGNVIPNPVYGHGFLDVPAAILNAPNAYTILRDGFE